MIKIAVNGALGRMGSRILALAGEKPNDFKVAHSFDLEKAESLLPYAAGEKKLACDVLIDFSGPDGANQCAAAAHHSKKGLVIGSTGLDDEFLKKIKGLAEGIPVVLSSNMSVGVNVMLTLIEEAAKKLSDDFSVRMTEAHHIHKKDAPSGTALMLLKALAGAKGWGSERTQQERDRIQSIREAEIVGDHTVIFSGPAESIEITHRAQSRDTFARGALLAAKFAAQAKPGRLYSMMDVLK